jgi:[ribosomal protein S5]-alanine N-acetyltransferase
MAQRETAREVRPSAAANGPIMRNQVGAARIPTQVSRSRPCGTSRRDGNTANRPCGNRSAVAQVEPRTLPEQGLPVPELQRLRADHAPAVLAFELANRTYFANFISDRGKEFFNHFEESYNELLTEQETGTCIFHVLIGEDGTVLGMFNLRDLNDGTAVLGYRVARHAAGRGVATATVQELCRVAAQRYRLRTLRAATSLNNVASQKSTDQVRVRPGWPRRPRRGRRPTWHLVSAAPGRVTPVPSHTTGRSGPPSATLHAKSAVHPVRRSAGTVEALPLQIQILHDPINKCSKQRSR